MATPQSTRALAGALLRDALAGREPTAGPRLVRVDVPAAATPLREGLTIGRGSGADLRLAEPEVSRRHARVVSAGGGLAIRDLGSKNGVALNGAPLRGGAAPLREGDVVDVGAVRLRVTGLGEPAPPAAPCGGPEPLAADLPARARPSLAAALALLAAAAALLAAAS
jgi:predicted component of type VI protein secretion system